MTQRLAHRLGHVLYLALGWIPELFTDTDSYLPGVGTK